MIDEAQTMIDEEIFSVKEGSQADTEEKKGIELMDGVWVLPMPVPAEETEEADAWPVEEDSPSG